MTKEDALHKLDKIFRANTTTETCGQFDESSYETIEDIEELKEDITNLINNIYEHNQKNG